MFNNCMLELYTAWSVAIRNVWRVPWITHCNMLLHITGYMGIELWCAARCIKFIKMACESKNVVVQTTANMGINGSYSIMDGNKRHLDLKFGMNKNKIHDIWNVICKDECTIVQTSMQVRELCEIRDTFDNRFLSREECCLIIEHLCTS